MRHTKKFWVVSAVVSVLVVGIMFNAARAQYKAWSIKADIRKLETEVERLDKENVSLAKLIEAFNDPAAIQRQARSRLNLRRPDEEVVILIPQEGAKDKAQTKSADNKETPQHSNLFKWWRKFFGP